MKTKELLIFLLLILSQISPTTAQVETGTKGLMLVRMENGNEYLGYIISQNEKEVVLDENNLGQITLQKADILDLRELREKEISDEGVIWLENPFGSRYFFAPNAHNLRKGEGYYQNSMVLFNQISYGFTDHFTLGIGIVPLFFFAGSSTPAWITPKFSMPIKEDKISLGLGGLFGAVIGEKNSGFGVSYGLLTLGNRDKNINFGLGYGYQDKGWADTPTISISGMLRMTNKFYLMSENYLINKDLYILSAGGRLNLRRANLDFGLISPFRGTVLDLDVGIPWISVGIPFGRNEKVINK